MKLFYRQLGAGKPLVVLHGLYGCSDNWLTFAREFQNDFCVVLPDLRNHGQSPHSDVFDITSMTNDIAELVADLKFKKICLLGHSLGGKVAMEFTYKYEYLVEKLVVVDIAPRRYHRQIFQDYNNHQMLINLLCSIDLSQFKSRDDALTSLSALPEGQKIKNLMKKNLYVDVNGKLQWKINIKAIAANLDNLLNKFEADLTKNFVPKLFVRGQMSNYLTIDDFDYIKSYIPNANVEEVPNAGHWLHIENPTLFYKIVKNFLL